VKPGKEVDRKQLLMLNGKKLVNKKGAQRKCEADGSQSDSRNYLLIKLLTCVSQGEETQQTEECAPG